jgi:hypothetical protein
MYIRVLHAPHANNHTSAQYTLTLVHESVSVPPSALVKYLPAVQFVHTVAPVAENDPLAHCTHTLVS